MTANHRLADAAVTAAIAALTVNAVKKDKMKVTKRQLRRIIKEEKSRLLVEMNPVKNAERSLGMYANTAIVDQLSKSVTDLLQNIEVEAIEDGLEEDEAEEMAIDAVVLAVAQAFQSAGMVAEYNALYDMVQRG